jgi:hypothetical protein
MRQRRIRRNQEFLAIADTATILTPNHFVQKTASSALGGFLRSGPSRKLSWAA